MYSLALFYGVPFAGYEMGVGFGTISGIPFARVPKNGRTLAEDICGVLFAGLEVDVDLRTVIGIPFASDLK